ncbi:MAG: PIN domain-containing protein [Solirubrobacteraceae bacterium]|nr:PIN domain-containing protein [Solirubrobacteraceae bacterium]
MIAPDSSVVIAALTPWHVAHREAITALRAAPRRLIAHVAFETTSALSRMPEGRRVAPAVVLEALGHDFPQPWLSLDGARLRAALGRAVEAGVRGGALYDALIAATAAAHDVELVSADERARGTYEALGVAATFISAAR